VQFGGDVRQRIERHASRSRTGCGVSLSMTTEGSSALMALPINHTFRPKVIFSRDLFSGARQAPVAAVRTSEILSFRAVMARLPAAESPWPLATKHEHSGMGDAQPLNSGPEILRQAVANA
jgi:hypothetical protein